MEMRFDEPRFETVSLNTFEPTECSPKISDPEFQGIVIDVPKKVTFEKTPDATFPQPLMNIPICGYYRFHAAILPQVDNALKAMRLVAVNLTTQKEYSGYLMEPHLKISAGEEAAAVSRDEEIEDVLVGGYFNSDISEIVDLPGEVGVYEMFVEFRERNPQKIRKSNVVSIEFAKK